MMFAIRHILSIIVLSWKYERSRSQRNFNNWLFDYIRKKDDGNWLKIHGLVYLLLKFSDMKDSESIETCLVIFDEQIRAHERLGRFKNKVLKKMDD